MKEWWRKFQRYLNRPAHARPLCLYRVGVALLVFLHAMHWLPHTTELFSNEGLHIGYLAHHAPSPASAKWLCSMVMVGAFLLGIGLLVKPALLVTLVIWTYFFAIDQIAEKAVVSLVIVVLFLLLFLPCARFYSVEAWLLARWKPDRKTPEENMPGLMFRLLQILFLQMYFFAGLVKLMEGSWRNGSALADAWSGRFSTDLGLWVAAWMPLVGYKMLSLGSIGFELLTPFGMNSRRWLGWTVLTAMMFHVCVQLTLHVGFLGYHFMLAIIFLFAIPGGLIPPNWLLQKQTTVLRAHD